MIVLQLLFTFIAFASGVLLAIFTYRRSKALFIGKESSFLKAAGNSILSGISVAFIFIGIAFVIGIADSNYSWETKEVITVLVLGLILGVIATLGSFWQFFLVGKFRKRLYGKLKNHTKD